MRKVNLLTPAYDDASQRDGYRWRTAAVGGALGAEQIGARLYELGAGQHVHPYHFHHALEEWLIVVAGAPALRTPSGERTLREGDVVCFPVGPSGAHEVTGPGSVLLIGSTAEADAIEYPDSGKLELRPAGTVFRLADAVELWEGQ